MRVKKRSEKDMLAQEAMRESIEYKLIEDDIKICTCCEKPCELEMVDLSFDYPYGDGHYTHHDSRVLSYCCNSEYTVTTVDDYNNPE